MGTPETQTIERLFQARASLAVVEQVVASLDEAGRQDPRFARETWQAASLAAITTWQSGADGALWWPELGDASSCPPGLDPASFDDL